MNNSFTTQRKANLYDIKHWARVFFRISSQCIAKTVVSPIERVKLLHQLSPLIPISRQTISVIKELSAKQGVTSLWRGNVVGCLAVSANIVLKELLEPLIRPHIVIHKADERKCTMVILQNY